MKRRIRQYRTVLIVLICCCTLVPFHSLKKSKRYLQSFSTPETLRISSASFAHEQGRSSNTTTTFKSFHNTSNNKLYKPLFVIHIGPVKTGTTTLQCALQSLSQDLLSLDKFVVAETESCRPDTPSTLSNLTYTKGGVATYDNVLLGKAFAPGCLGQWSQNVTGMPACWIDSYERFARQHAQQNHSIIISNEILSQVTSKVPVEFVYDLVESLHDFQVKIVVTYRPWFEWVASLQDQTTKGFLEKYRDWPGHGNTRARKLESLQHYIGRQLSNRRRQHLPAQSFPFVDDAIQIFQNDSRIQLEILDIREKGDLITNFVCEALSGATNTCNKLKSGNSKHHDDKNKAENRQWYDMLAVEAYEKGLVSSRSRLHVFKRIRDFQETRLNKSSTDFAKACPSETFLKRIWRETLRRQKNIRPKQQHGHIQRKLRITFDKAVQSEKFCTINATAVLEDQQWINFFERLGGRRRKK